MRIQQRLASPALRSVIRSFAERRASLGQQVVTAPLPARPDQIIEIYLADRYRVSQDDGPPDLAPETVIVGPQSYRRTRLLMSGEIHVFTIRFQPSGFHRLFGTPMTDLADQGAFARDVIGGQVDPVRDAIALAASFDGRVAVAERWIGERLAGAGPEDEVGRLAAMLERSGGRLRIDALAQRAMMSERQFTRRFATQVGLTPKLFARTVRFNAVLDAKARSPRVSWTELVHRWGYADQSHFIRDSHAFAGGAPAGFFPEWLQGR